MTTIAYVENHIAFRSLFVQCLERERENCIVYVYDNGLDFTKRFPLQNYTPSIVLMDIRMPEMNGYETTKWIKKHFPSIPVLAFSDLEDPRAMEAIIESGADGYTSKTRSCISGRMQKIITQIIDGTGYYDNPELHRQTREKMKINLEKTKLGINALTDTEMKVLRNLPSDKSANGQAKEIYRSINTYNNHIKNISIKLGTKTSKTLMKLAYSLGLIEL